ncbi:MAG: Asp-tRNA(Asn)/Glu-tRNA(Gln) amidotransferase subunit GatA [Meiothermus sp.]|uniref:Asp-tRNA(Asn)/Glu-tRNA(Gln) amidotransferase subunit GatA n=1 Tax=Meiothermus sp. TaxID=1955249 RepID=UPI0025F10E8B|nr:Asp-tRNA(Asn)/Glu-tRNA(Gln) amidotransferase subunit GatA [Meiothermus sp.]MCS7059146.1 Asp-tRNA(Asn)/Glu-tRNA(Gln) amidotransferase subunit GatA [Meiothermus sp.]MCS7195482.1 Asp-tRNA(Asn)/Glu-tRNA(Gln) amidotransferase subunit GatA [Meiothermus sp.]MCX7741207.1 Asp-tRNA(Asn)/Glu-tRNA(Gln) amidotransferase subunit GatA [Meiothermus sp.]MDW8090410.1 Asp-tRNA(Asn)/Glu-tRNA(Gln) amidotransferase subunit GatA [Meiothermus sp.]MDW8481088.1 Asp-tRNA(Asn)/Glu-tRNA(Gln) amidotransferase subunit Ga
MLAQEIAELVRSGQTTPSEVLNAYLARIERLEPQLRAFIRLNPRALEEARQVEGRLGAGEVLPLAGVPVALKDNICTRGLETTCASRVLASFVPPYDATVVERLRQAGAVVLGKTNMDEFAMGSSTEYSAFGPTRNPWDPERVPGGTSGGSAAAVAADLAPVALGTDTGGSVRQPAAFCGVYGFKPTYGRISRYGVVATASSLDQVGTLARTVADLALLTDVVSGPDPRDSTSLEAEPRFAQALGASVRGLTVGLVREALAEGNSPGVLEALERFRAVMEGRGVRFVEVSVPTLRYALAAYYIVNTAEISSNLARYDGTLYGLRVPGEDSVATMMRSREKGFGPEARRRILMGTFVLSAGYYAAYYGRALRARARLKMDMEAAFSQADLLLTPTSPTPAFRLGEKTGDPLAMYLADVDTVAVNLVGLPAMSLPAGFEGHLPVGLQLVAPPMQDEMLFSLAQAFEEATERQFARQAPL